MKPATKAIFENAFTGSCVSAASAPPMCDMKTINEIKSITRAMADSNPYTLAAFVYSSKASPNCLYTLFLITSPTDPNSRLPVAGLCLIYLNSMRSKISLILGTVNDM